MEKYIYYYKDFPLEIYIKKSTGKNLIIKIDSEQRIVVSRPALTFDFQVEKFINKHLEWAYEHQNKTIKNTQFSYEEKFVYLFGKRYIIQVNEGYSETKTIIKNNVIYVLLEQLDEVVVTKAIYKLLDEEIAKYIPESLSKWSEIMGVEKYAVKIEKRSSTWGVNYPSPRRLVFNTNLIHFNKDVIDYVVIHELAHDFERNHSDKFWKIVEKYCPDFKECRKALRNNKDIEEE